MLKNLCCLRSLFVILQSINWEDSINCGDEKMRLKSLGDSLVVATAFCCACATRLIVHIETARVILLVCRVEGLPDVLIV